MARIIAVVNQKGGVGKTTTVVNLGHALALEGHRTTLLDLDPQGHLAASLGVFRRPSKGIAEVMQGRVGLDEVLINNRNRLFLIPAGPSLGDYEVPEDPVAKLRLLAQVLDGQFGEDEIVLIDCPPSSSWLVVNALFAADEVLIPVTGDYLGLNGLAHLMMSIKKIQRHRHSPLQYWIVLSRFYPTRKLSKEVVDKLNEHFAGHILNTAIRETAVLTECPAMGRTIFECRTKSKVADDFKALVDDLLKRRTS